MSYAAASFRENGLSVEHTNFDRVLGFDSASGIVEVECGISLQTLHRFLKPRGLFLKAQPGYARITVGGCIAVDVHGKNQARDGTFMQQVAGLTLHHPSHGEIEIGPKLEPELFRLTCGGYGLTGHILCARLQASQVPADSVEVVAEPVSDLISGTARLTQLVLEADFVYSWHDLAATTRNFGRGLAIAARFVPGVPVLRSRDVALSMSAANRGSWRAPLLNRWTARVLNAAYLHSQLRHRGGANVTLEDALFPVHGRQSYFKLFGTAGFHEYQAIIPIANLATYAEGIRDYLRRRPVAIALASGKIFAGTNDLLRFSGAGLCFALNFPRTVDSADFLSYLDNLVVSIGGMPNIIKDSRLPVAVVNATYPEADVFRERLRSFDPKRLFRSELSDRLQL